MEHNDIAIVGISIASPAGDTPDEFWNGIAGGGDFITDMPDEVIESEYFDDAPNGVDRFYCRRGGVAKSLKVEPLRYGILPITADGINPDELLCMAGTEDALTDADVFKKGIPLQKCSIIIGKGDFGSLISLRTMEVIRFSNQFIKLLKVALPNLTEDDLERVKKGYQRQMGRFGPDMVIGAMPSLVASMVANRFDMHGPAYTVDAACASGIVAIDHSIALLRSGECDIAVAGGLHSAHSAIFWSVFELMGALSKKQVCAPFSRRADGLLIGQGGGFLILKTLERAIDEGDRIYAILKETAVSSDGAGSHVIVTNADGQTRVMDKAWGKSGMDPKKLGLIEAHGTATPVGDRTELASLTRFFGDRKSPRAYLGSVKSNIGHTMPAAGMIGIIKTALALYHRKIPPTLHCEEPLEAMAESRFRPPQALMDWDGEKIPLVAGVNAFGFGGSNSHAILTAYEPRPQAPPQPRILPWRGESVAISAESRELLIEKLENGSFTHTGGDYRLAILEPTEERIRLAVDIVKKDKPWQGRLNIWYSNRPLLTHGGKLVFLFPGLTTERFTETDSLSERLNLPEVNRLVEEKNADSEEARVSRWTHFCAKIALDALEALGVQPDMYGGHSIGEFTGIQLTKIMDGDLDLLHQLLSHADPDQTYPMIATGGMDREEGERLCSEIPNLYLANDNCPSQLVFTGTEEAVAAMKKKMDEMGLYHMVMPVGWAVHTPLHRGTPTWLTEYCRSASFHEAQAPFWSGISLAPIPADRDAFKEHVEKYFNSPVRFRELIHALYREQNARVFIQIGPGSLVGYVEETLKDSEFSVVATNTSTRDGLEQMRRVMAMLFVEGKEPAFDFLGVKRCYQTGRSLYTLPNSEPRLLTDLPELKEVVNNRYGEAGPGASLQDPGEGDHPFLHVAKENMRGAMEAQSDLVRAFAKLPLRATAGTIALSGEVAKASLHETDGDMPIQSKRPPAPALQVVPDTDLSDFAHEKILALEDYPFLLDHAIVHQPAEWSHADDLNPVVPFSLTIELLAEEAMKYAGGRKLVKILRLIAYRFIEVGSPMHLNVRGHWIDSNTLSLEYTDYAKGEFVFDEAYPEPPAEYIGDVDIGKELATPKPASYYYQRYAFHGPKFQSIQELRTIASKGMVCMAQLQEGRGSLLDVMGQQLGMFLHLTQTVDTISFPVRIREMTFYADLFDQKGEFILVMLIRKLTSRSIHGDMILKRDGKIWCVGREWVNQRFATDEQVLHVLLYPERQLLARRIAPGIYRHIITSIDLQHVLMRKRYTNFEDRKHLSENPSSDEMRDWLSSRIVMKDAVRQFIAEDMENMLFPVEVFCDYEQEDSLHFHGMDQRAAPMADMHVSFSVIDGRAVAAVSDKPIGIAIKKTAEAQVNACVDSFSAFEKNLLEGLPQPESGARFIVAKEAYVKKYGGPHCVEPGSCHVTGVDEHIVFVENQKVQTMQIDEETIAGWTTE